MGVFHFFEIVQITNGTIGTKSRNQSQIAKQEVAHVDTVCIQFKIAISTRQRTTQTGIASRRSSRAGL